MKKITFFLFLSIVLVTPYSAQVTTLLEAPPYDGGGSANRCPNGTSAHAYLRAAELVLQSELTGISSGNTITAFGFTMNSGTSNVNVTGAFTVYLQNTTDIAYLKGTTWSTILTGMTQVYANVATVPISTGATSIVVTLSTPFVYSGGGIYAAWEWSSLGPFDSYLPAANMYRCNYLTLNPGCASGVSASAAPTTLGSTNFRPCLLFGIPNLLTNDMQLIGIEAPGRVPAMLNTAHIIKGIVKNGSNTTLNSVSVNLNVGGANPFTSAVTIPSLAAGAINTVNFAAFNPMTPGLNTITVTLTSDQNNNNNLGTYVQTVTCNEWAYNPPVTNYSNSVGFNTGSGIIACNYSHPVTTTLSALRCAISTNSPSAGNNTWGVLLSSTGGIIATTNTITITSGMLGTQQVLTFANPPVLTGGTTYYFGFAQPVNAVGYFPAAALTAPYVSQSIYITTLLTGGVLTPLLQNLGYFGIEAIFTPTITLAAASQTVVCGAQTTVTALSSTNYSWNTGATTSSFVATPTVNTTYTVIATNTLGCMLSKTVGISITPITLTASTSNSVICLGKTVTLSVVGADSYSWNTGSSPTSSVFADNPFNSTLYTVVGTNSTGCSNTSSIAVSVQAFTGLQLSANNITICKGNTLTVMANGAATYTWNLGSTSFSTASVVDQPLANIIYTVIGADNLGCEMTKTVNVTVNFITVTVALNPQLCLGETATLVPTGASSYSWVGSSFPNLTVSPTVTTTYTVTGTGANTCTNSLAVTVTVNPTPTLTVIATRTLICKGETTTLSVSGASSYTWTGGINNASFIITPTVVSTPIYTVNGVDSHGCSSTGSTTYKVTSCSGLTESGLSSLVHVFPNPASDAINIRFEGNSPGTVISVHASNGALVGEMPVVNETSVFDLSGTAAGLYFVTVTTPGEQPVRIKIIKN